MRDIHEWVAPDGRKVVVEYRYDEARDSFFVEFSGELLRSDIEWEYLRDALVSMAQTVAVREPTE